MAQPCSRIFTQPLRVLALSRMASLRAAVFFKLPIRTEAANG